MSGSWHSLTILVSFTSFLSHEGFVSRGLPSSLSQHCQSTLSYSISTYQLLEFLNEKVTYLGSFKLILASFHCFIGVSLKSSYRYSSKVPTFYLQK